MNFPLFNYCHCKAKILKKNTNISIAKQLILLTFILSNVVKILCIELKTWKMYCFLFYLLKLNVLIQIWYLNFKKWFETYFWWYFQVELFQTCLNIANWNNWVNFAFIWTLVLNGFQKVQELILPFAKYWFNLIWTLCCCM